jgi:hypothetical protein
MALPPFLIKFFYYCKKKRVNVIVVLHLITVVIVVVVVILKEIWKCDNDCYSKYFSLRNILK